ncbi:MAG: sulfite exporter TauE/SafE family protein [Candidatus Aminicenantes bacterium]|nr:sulfite exporter TauE/SafE family protein [Candidatus Aminicenantes bacterium]
MESIWILVGTAATIGFVHTLIGPDHYLPFIVISRARQWRLSKTLGMAFLCGLGHVLSSVILGFIGIGLGIAVSQLEKTESTRGNIASWLLIGFGLAYAIWGLRRALSHQPHVPPPSPLKERLNPEPRSDHKLLSQSHHHEAERLYFHETKEKKSLTPWILFIIFVLGPCEPLIPLVMFPAAQHSIGGVILVTIAFGAATILTMLTLIALSAYGLSFIKLGPWEKYSHALAGSIIFLSGLAVQFLGL